MHSDVLADLTSWAESAHSHTGNVMTRMAGSANVGEVLTAVSTWNRQNMLLISLCSWEDDSWNALLQLSCSFLVANLMQDRQLTCATYKARSSCSVEGTTAASAESASCVTYFSRGIAHMLNLVHKPIGHSCVEVMLQHKLRK